MFTFLHATDFVNTSFTDFYEKKLTEIDPFMVTVFCHHEGFNNEF